MVGSLPICTQVGAKLQCSGTGNFRITSQKYSDVVIIIRDARYTVCDDNFIKTFTIRLYKGRNYF